MNSDRREFFSDVPGNATNRMAELHAKKELKEGRRISLSEVARETNVDRRTLGKWYRNEIDVFYGPVIAALCKYYDCAVNDLLVIDYGEDIETGQLAAVAAP
ncbi:MAG: helix-turn-helix transcriptional regulator [Chloroflexi bacterium]|nr:helix-turn-helix transcriptional regulator [Chloroflexota bacterium]